MNKKLLAKIVLIGVIFSSCTSDNITNEAEPEIYTSGVLSSKSTDDGKININTALNIDDVEYDVEWDLTIKSEEGEALSDIEYSYTELNEKLLLYIEDNENNYLPILLHGRPNEISDYLNGQRKTYKSKGQKPLVIITATLFMVGVSAAYIKIANGIAEAGAWYRSGFVEENEDYTLYCKDLNEIGEMVEIRTDFLVNTGNIAISLVGFTVGGTSTVDLYKVIETFLFEVGKLGADEIQSFMYEKMLEEQFSTANELNGGRKFGVRVFFEDEASLRNMFAKLEIIDDEPKCSTQTEGDWQRDTTTEVVDVTNPATGQTWMDRNLGASRAATSSTDEQAYGDLYQWGRAADGHEKRHSGTTTTLSHTDQPGHDDFILSTQDEYDWRSPRNNNLWQGVNGVNNPCPTGYRLPTEAEWEAERQSWSSNNAAGAFESVLKLPVAGTRSGFDDTFNNVGSFGFYWSSTVLSTVQYWSGDLLFGTNDASNDEGGARSTGESVRCIKD